MAKFCTKCGKELKDNKPCNCKNSFKKEQSEQVIDDHQYSFSNIVEIFKNMIKKPIDTVKELLTKNDFDLSIVLIAINTLSFAILFVIGMKQLFCMNYGYHIASQLNIPYFRYFMLAMIFVVIAHLMFAGITYLIFRIYNKNIEFKTLFNLSATISVSLTAANIINIFVSMISIPLALVIMMISILISFISLYEGIMKVSDIEDNKAGYIAVISIITYIFIYVLLMLQIII